MAPSMSVFTSQSRLLFLAGCGSAAVALLHIAVIVIGPAAYRYFGAPDLAPLAERGSPAPALVTSALVVVFAVWALYAFSGAGLVRPLPLLRPALLGIGSIYTLRGLLFIPEVVYIVMGKHLAPRMAVFSAVSLAIGILYLVGSWGHFEPNTPKPVLPNRSVMRRQPDH